MTLLGKIFTVMIFMMSLLFMSFAIMVYATHKNWKELVTAEETGLLAQNRIKEGTITELRNEQNEILNNLARERAARRAALSVLETKVSQSAQMVTQKQQELDRLNVALGEAVQQVKSAHEQLAALVAENAALKVENRDVQIARDANYAQMIVMKDKVNSLDGDMKNLTERASQLNEQVSRYKGILDRRGLSVDTPIDLIEPDLQGFISAVSNNEFVEITLGGDDGLIPGHEFHVFRDRTYLGKVVIKKVAPNRAVGQVIKETSRGVIQRGDRVATKLS
ncbi:hypothetical protein [Lignipirellula cremea]|uniref:Chromosome partition protein Smc n=1 Tax=Lignipirellula cremea TaxID=2528010 RepID=A0A518DUZ4_9BACT|nr:hypothetical protein [Lignipirellula cremea]QDU95653.1 Chromosome partition protein Smc [Lignipirellula cremea]